MSQPEDNRLEPTQFDLQGYNVTISYSTTTLTGVPQLNFSDRDRQRNFRGEEIQLEESQFGRSVTVLLNSGAADEPIESLTLLLPVVQLTTEVSELAIQSLAIFSTRAAFVNPNNPAQLQNYDALCLSGTARFVVS